MDHRVGDFLSATYASKSLSISEPFDTRHALFIAESRPSFWLPKIIDNFRRHHPTWPLYLVGTPDVFRLVVTTLGPDGIIPLPFAAPTSPTEYSHLMLSTDLWNAITHTHVLVFQLDTVCLRPVFPEIYDDYAMVGAVCGHVQLPGEPDRSNDWTIQGGLSYRNVHAMRRATHAIRPEERHLPEDIVLTRTLRRLDETLPSLHTCLDFAIEAFGNPRTAIGMHGVDKLYVPPSLIAATLPSSPNKRPLFYVIQRPSDDSAALGIQCTLFRHIADRIYIEGDPVPHLDDTPVTWIPPGHLPDIPDAALVLVTDPETIPDPAVLLDTLPNVTTPIRLAGDPIRLAGDPIRLAGDPIRLAGNPGHCILAPSRMLRESPTLTLPNSLLDTNQRWITALFATQKK